jgi:hypothetical protein
MVKILTLVTWLSAVLLPSICLADSATYRVRDFETGMSEADALRIMESQCVDVEHGPTSCALDDGSFIALGFTRDTKALSDIEYSMKTNMSCEELTKFIIDKYKLYGGKAPECGDGGWVYFARKYPDDKTPEKMMRDDRRRVEISFSFNYGAPMLRILDVSVLSADRDAQEKKSKANVKPPKL